MTNNILNTSANLLGFCLFVITSLHINNKIETSNIDELTAIVSVLLTISCFLSFLSIRTRNPITEQRLENYADNLFIVSLLGILVTILLISLNFIPFLNKA